MFKLLSAVLALASCLAARAQVFVPVMSEKDRTFTYRVRALR